MNRIAISATMILSLAALAMACGPSRTSKKGMSKLAAGAPPPPDGSGKKLDRDISKEAEEAFAEAAAFYKKSKEAGWTEQSCRDASRRFASVADSHKKMVEARYNAGLALQNCQMMKAAEDEYQKALRINAGHAPSLANLGEIYYLGGNEARAKQYWEKAVKADGKIVAARNNLAWLIIRDMQEGKGSFKTQEAQVKRHLSSALAVDNDNVEAYVLYSLLYMERSDRNKSRLTLAKLLLDKGEELNDEFAPLHNARGLLLLKQDNVPRALASFRKAAELDPKFVEARMNVGNIVLGFRKYAEAKEQFEAVLRLDPKNYDAMIGLGYAQRGLRELDAAEQTYTKARKLDGARPDASFNLGILYKDFRANATEDLKVAQKAYRQAAVHFKTAQAKAGGDAGLKKEAKQNLEDCEKNIKSLDEAIKFQQQNQP